MGAIRGSFWVVTDQSLDFTIFKKILFLCKCIGSISSHITKISTTKDMLLSVEVVLLFLVVESCFLC